MVESWQEKAVIRIIDDDEGFGDAIRFILRMDGWMVSYYSDVSSFLKKDDPEVPGCIILDYMMPNVNGVECQELLIKKGYRQPVIFLTAHADVDMAITVFRQGAYDVLKKPVSSEDLLSAVRKAVREDFIKAESDVRVTKYHELFDSLSQREKQVVSMAVSDLMNHQIAQRLNLSERTIETHRANAYRKLGIKDLVQLKEFMKHI